MKIKLLLLAGVGFVPSVLMSQSFLYNKGVMSIKSAAPTNTTLYIDGNFIAGHDATTSCDITLDKSKTVLTGDFIHDLNGTPAATSNVFQFLTTDNSQFVFRGATSQKVRLQTGVVYDELLKGRNYIGFPTLVVDNNQHVFLTPELAAQAKSLTLAKGRLILDSRRITAADIPAAHAASTMHSAATSTMMAHFMVAADGNIDNTVNATIAATTTDHNNFGAVQVNLEVANTASETATEKNGRSLIGMGSPYKEMLSDYFFWNFLMIPRNESIIGGETVGGGNTMTDPQRVLKAGEGFVIGLDLRGTSAANYEYDLHPKYQSITPVAQKPKFADRNTGKYEFSRFGSFFNNSNNVKKASGWAGKPSTIHADVAETSIANGSYSGEVLNYKNITNLKIQEGYNYYSNPYTVPLDVSAIVEATGATLAGWNVKVGTAANTDRHFTNKVWVLDPSSKGSGSYDILNSLGIGPGNKWVMADAKYRVLKAVGSTYTPGTKYDTGVSSAEALIAPLQMFILWAPKAVAQTLTIPADSRRIGGNAYFLRSTSTTSEALRNDFLFTVEDVQTKSVDKVAIVLRTPQEVMTNAKYEGTAKLRTLFSSNGTTTRSSMEQGSVTQTNMSTLYTKSDVGVPLESNVLGVPATAESETVTLYLTPSLTAQNINITAGRLETADGVKQIFLKDKVRNVEFDLFTGKTYTAASKPTDPLDRFTLRFVFDTSGVEDGDYDLDSKSITSYYQSGILTVTGFDDADLGSLVSVYDIQGRMLAQSKVSDTQVEIAQAFSSGAYIVKVVGNKSYAAKFLVK